MSKERFTPAPWLIVFSMNDENRKAVANHRGASFFVQQIKSKYEPRDEANARLIARSPSMLALLEKALPIIEAEADNRTPADFESGSYFTEMRELANEIEAEIRKAKGGSNG